MMNLHLLPVVLLSTITLILAKPLPITRQITFRTATPPPNVSRTPTTFFVVRTPSPKLNLHVQQKRDISEDEDAAPLEPRAIWIKPYRYKEPDIPESEPNAPSEGTGVCGVFDDCSSGGAGGGNEPGATGGSSGGSGNRSGGGSSGKKGNGGNAKKGEEEESPDTEVDDRNGGSTTSATMKPTATWAVYFAASSAAASATPYGGFTGGVSGGGAFVGSLGAFVAFVGVAVVMVA